jgi:hypothetical protein
MVGAEVGLVLAFAREQLVEHRADLGVVAGFARVAGERRHDECPEHAEHRNGDEELDESEATLRLAHTS